MEGIIFPKMFDICTNHPKSKIFLSDDLLIVCCKEALCPPRFRDLVLVNEFKMVENCEIDLIKKHEMRNCIFYSNGKIDKNDFKRLCLFCKIDFLTSVSVGFCRIRNVY